MRLRFLLLPFLFVSSVLAQSVDLQLELMNQVGTDVSRKGDLVSGRVISPAQFQGDVVEGKIAELRSGSRQGGASVLTFNFSTLRHGGQVVRIKSRVKSVANSRGQADVDEQGRVVRQGSNRAGSSVKGANIGSRLGGLLGGGRGAAVGSLADVTAVALTDVTSDAPNIDFNAGSRLVLETSADGGGSLASLAPNQPMQNSPAPVHAPVSPVAEQGGQAQAGVDGQPQFATLKATFIPGEKTLFYDDFTDMGPDDAPAHFKVRGAGTELRAYGKVHQLTILQRTELAPNLTSLPQNFTYEAEIACEPEGGRVMSTLVLFSKTKEVFRLDLHITAAYWEFAASLRDPYSNLGSKRLETDGRKPARLAMWVQNGRLRVFYDGEKQLDFNQVEMAAIDRAELQHAFYGGKFIGYRMVRFAESTPDFGKVISSTGRYVTHGILFDTDSDHLKPESAPVRQSIARGLENNPNLKLLIEGHTDSVGSATHNMDLSRRRADAVKTVLVSQFNVETERLSTAGIGATKPIDTNDTPQGRAQNRRVELVKQ